MEGFSAKSAGHEVFLVPKGPTQIAHLLKNKPRVIKTAPDRIGIVAPLIILSLIVLHHLLQGLIFEDRNYILIGVRGFRVIFKN